MMKLATFNIAWLGGDKIERTEEDKSLIARVIAKLDADVVVFQEIVDPKVLQEIVDSASVTTLRSYRLYDNDNQLLGVGKDKDQKVVITYDDQGYELMAASPIFGGIGRLPYGVRIQKIANGTEVLIVGVHFQSGYPNFTDQDDAEKRKKQCQHLADWIAGQKVALNPVFPMPLSDERVVIMGDFNALYDSNQPAYAGVVASLNPLREGHMAEWCWEKPLADPAGGDRQTSYLEGLLIDFAMLSPSLKGYMITPPTIYAFDHDPDIGVADARVSDHRPVFVEIDISPE
jgi:endonuclease/exonuclease/phosphatase family metal-dependent hydrolase